MRRHASTNRAGTRVWIGALGLAGVCMGSACAQMLMVAPLMAGAATQATAAPALARASVR